MAKQSPYQKHGKTPFRYEHPSCRHSRSTFQSVVPSQLGLNDGWRGTVCATCNIIIEKFAGDRPLPRYIAEAA